MATSLLFSAGVSLAATLSVTTTNDTGAGSLRQAITEANNVPGPDTISFAIAEAGPHRIQPVSELPRVTDPVVIDGYTQPGSAANDAAVGHNAMLRIELDGSNVITNGLWIGTSNCLIRGLAIFRFAGDGIHVEGGTSNRVAGNFIGTDASGTNALGNGLSGIELSAAHGNLIGGPGPEDRNLVAGNLTDGIHLSSGSGNVIQGNYVGTDVTGARSLGNTRGVTLLPLAPGNVIGRTAAGAGNLISGNTQIGLNVLSSQNRIEGNVVGLDASASTGLGNGTYGILLAGGGNRVGGTNASEANIVSANGSTGVVVTDSDAIGNALLGNRIFENGGLGIDLDEDGPSDNDEDDSDEGANQLQNHPVVGSVLSGATWWIQASLTSSPSTTFRIEFFLSGAQDPAGRGEGRDFLGATNVITGLDGVVEFTWATVPGAASSAFLTATATDPSGNTSEFSPAFPIPSEPVTNTVIRINDQTAAGNVMVTNEARVEILSRFANGSIFYTLDGSAPADGAGYRGAFELAQTSTIRAVAFSAGRDQSEEAIPVTLLVLHSPRITLAPAAASVVAGSDATFRVAATGTAPLGYQWRRNGNHLPDAISSTFVLTNVQSSQAGDYTVVVTNSVGSVTSAVALLTVNLSPAIGTQPVTQTVPRGGTAMFCIDATGSAPLVFQWRLNGVNIAGATNACLSITNVQLTDGGAYSVVVANEAGAITSDPASLVVDVPPLAPGDYFTNRVALLTNTVRGANATFSIEPGEPEHVGKPGGRSAWYSWRAPTNGIARFRTVGSGFDTLLAIYTGDKVDQLAEVASDEDTGGFLTSEVRFRGVAETDYAIALDAFTGAGGPFTLDWEIEPTADVLPVILAEPGSRNVTRGSTVILAVDATDAAGTGLSYQWHFNQVPLLAATSATLTLSDVQPAQVGFYSATIRNAAGREVVTRPAAIELGDRPGPVSADKFEDIRAGPGGGFLQPAGSSVSPPAYTVAAGDLGSHYLNNVMGTTSADETNHCGVVNNSTRWIFLTTTNNGTMVVDTEGSGIPTVLAVYTKTLFGRSALPVACGAADPSEPGGFVRASFTASSGTTYAVVVDGLNRTTGLIRLGWALGNPPSVPAFNPTSVVVNPGATVMLAGPTVSAFPSASYQWLLNGAPIPNATNITLPLPNVQADDEGLYALSIRNPIGASNIPVGTVYLDLPLLPLRAVTFDAGIGSWSMELSPRALAIEDSGGNPDECVVVTAGTTAETWYWSAPDVLLGDLSSGYGGWLQFDLQEPAPPITNSLSPLVQISGAGRTILFEEEDHDHSPGPGWKRYRVPLVENGRAGVGAWRKPGQPPVLPTRDEFLQTLSNVEVLWIRGRADAYLSARLDNVAILDARGLKIGLNAEEGLLITWSEGFVPFQLEARDSLAPNAPWTTNIVIGRHTTDKGLHQVDLLPAGATRYFRLAKPE